MVARSTLSTAKALLERFFRDADGRTNRQIDVEFLLADLRVGPDRAIPALEFLVSRGLINRFGPEIAFLTAEGIEACVQESDLSQIEVARPFAPEPDPTTEDQNSTPDVPRLVQVRIDGAPTVTPLEGLCTIGRAEGSDVVIDDARASKRHAVVRFERGGFVLEDLESANGTLLNGAYCVEPTRLGNDDEIVIGRAMLVVQIPAGWRAPAEGLPAAALPRTKPLGPATERPEPLGRIVEGRVVEGRPADAPPDVFGPGWASPKTNADLVSDVDLLEDQAAEVLSPRSDPEPLELGASIDGAPPSQADPLDLDDPLDPEDLEIRLPLSGAGSIGDEIGPKPGSPAPGPSGPAELDFGSASADLEVPSGGATVVDDNQTIPPDDDIVELSDVVVEPRTGVLVSDGVSNTELDATDDTLTLIGGLDLGGETLPVATPSLVDFELPAEVTPPALLASLGRLRNEVSRTVGPGPLLDAVDRLLGHPLVRGFAERDDPRW